MTELMEMQKNATPEMQAEFDKRMTTLKSSVKAEYFKALEDNKQNFASGLIFEDLMRDRAITIQSGPMRRKKKWCSPHTKRANYL